MTNHCRSGMRPHFRRLSNLLLSAFLLLISALAIADRTYEARQPDSDRVKFKISGQSVPAALGEFAKQAGLQLFFITDGFEDVQTNAVTGSYPIQQALDILLEGTGLTANYSREYGIKVMRVRAPMESLISGSQQFTAATDEPKRKNSSGRNVSKLQRSMSSKTDDSEKGSLSSTIEEIVVTGTHIRGGKNVGASTMSFSREQLEKTGFVTVEQFFESLPQNLDEISADGVTADGVSRVASANTQGASSISLRGLGPGSTLILLNGKRRPGNVRGLVVDTSAIPLSMIEQVEVVTGGRAAIYGSDAVAGVVNIITRRELDGAETQLSYGEASAGGGQLEFSQSIGREFGRGGFVLGYTFRDDRSLDAADAGIVRAPSIVGVTPLPGLFDLRLSSEQHAGLLAGHLKLTNGAELYADAQFSDDRNKNGRAFDFLGLVELGALTITDSKQYSAVGGVRLDIGNGWQADVSALHGVVDNVSAFTNLALPVGSITTFDIPLETADDDEAKLTSLSMIADGPLGELRGRTALASIGAEFREESYERIRTDLLTGAAVPHEDIDRDIGAIFAEVLLPLGGFRDQRLDLSLAARYEDYSDFGDTFNPQIGVEWQPLNGLTLRGAYAEAFRAPDLFTLAQTTQVSIRLLDDPLGNPAGTTPVFSEFGGNPDLRPEEAETWTLGIDWKPSDRTNLSLSYFRIDYEGRIDQPAENALTVLRDEFLFAGLVNRDPTAQEMQAVLDRLPDASDLLNNTGIPFDPASDDPFAVFPGLVYFDNRRNNIGLEAVRGLDFQGSTVFETSHGELSLSLSGTHYIDFERNITATSPTIDQLNRPGKPVDLKLRGRIGWASSAWWINAYVNYIASYDDTVAAIPGRIGSWTTVDLTWILDTSRMVEDGPLGGTKVMVGINNVLDKDPPAFRSNLFGLGYDAANANAIGRFVSLRLTKAW